MRGATLATTLAVLICNSDYNYFLSNNMSKAVSIATTLSKDTKLFSPIYDITTSSFSLSNMIESILELFRSKESSSMSYIHKRLSYILDEEELLEDNVILNIKSFIGLRKFANNTMNIQNFSIFVSDDGISNIIYTGNDSDISLKFIDDNSVYYIYKKYNGDILANKSSGYSNLFDIVKKLEYV